MVHAISSSTPVGLPPLKLLNHWMKPSAPSECLFLLETEWCKHFLLIKAEACQWYCTLSQNLSWQGEGGERLSRTAVRKNTTAGRLQLQTKSPALIITTCRSFDEILHLPVWTNASNWTSTLCTLCFIQFNPSEAHLRKWTKFGFEKKCCDCPGCNMSRSSSGRPFFSLPYNKNTSSTVC